MTWQDVSRLVATYNPSIQWDKPDASQPIWEHWFTYVAKPRGLKRIVWFTDHDSVAAKHQLAHEMGIKGIAIWALGEEDPEVWAALSP